MREATFETTDWMEWFCGEREWQKTPFVAAGLRIATDAMILVSCPSSEPATAFVDAKDQSRVNLAVGIGSRSASNALEVSRERLAAWAGPCEYPKKITCPNCCTHFVDVPYKRPGRILGLVIDRNLLAYVLAKAPACDTLRIAVASKERLVIDGDGWRGLICRITDDGQERPTFNPMAKEVASALRG